MRLYFLDPSSRPAINIRRLRNLGFNTHSIITPNVEQNRQALIVLGDGSPEDQVFAIVSYHLDGNRVVGITKPDQPHLAAINQLRTYVERLNVGKILIVIDQDDRALDDLLGEVERRIRGIAIDIQQPTITDERVRGYQCTLSHRVFEIIVVVSGLDSFNTSRHMIEDHLLELAGYEEADHPKELWRDHLSADEREDVFRMLQDEEVVEVVFPQHTRGCRHLE